jgi:hypothetical protein
MNPEDVVRRFERRAGFKLIDYARVALPLYRLTVDAVTMSHREIPPTKEFVMRAVGVGIVTETEIAAFLGLDSATVGAVLLQLREDRYAA